MNPFLLQFLQQLQGMGMQNYGNPFSMPQALHSLFGGNAFGLPNMGMHPMMGLGGGFGQPQQPFPVMD